jgi:hypothetical protein
MASELEPPLQDTNKRLVKSNPQKTVKIIFFILPPKTKYL